MSDYDVTLNAPYGNTNFDYNNDSFDEVSVYVGSNFSTVNMGVILTADPTDMFRFYISGTLDYTIGSNGFGTRITFTERGSEEEIGRVLVQGEASFATSTVCFTRGARILTPAGEVAVETLRPGDLVVTRDRGAQPVRWIGRTRLSAETLAQFPEKRPVRIAAGTFGAHGPTAVSPAHRILLSGWRAEALFGEAEVLAPAGALVNDTTVRRAGAAGVEYVHIMFDAHEIVRADGLWSESFHPAALATGVDAATRDEVIELFPELESGAVATPVARPALDAAAVRVLLA